MIEVIIPGEAPSTPNLREHWAAKAKRTKAQRAKVMAKMPAWPSGPLLFVRLTRVAPRALDSDNLAGALKGHRDAVAGRLRVDDGSPLVHWSYAQVKGEASVVVQMWGYGEVAPPAYSPPATGAATTFGREVMREMLKPPGEEDYGAAVKRAMARGSPTNPISTKALEPSNATEHRALLAAQLAEETFAPGACMDCTRGASVSDGRCQACLDAITEYSKRPGFA